MRKRAGAIGAWSVGGALLGCSMPVQSGSPSSNVQAPQQTVAVSAADASALEAGARTASGCEIVAIGLDEATPYGFTPNDALTALHAAEPTLAKWAGCPSEPQDWSLFFEAQPGAQANLTARAVLTWSSGSSGGVRCEF